MKLNVEKLNNELYPDFKFDINKYKFGGTIHIKEENKGKFTATKKATGKTTEELTHSKNPLTKKRVIFAQNAKHFKHQQGGQLIDLINRTNNKNIDFVNRLKDPKRKFITNWENPKQIATHKMSWATDENGKAIIYPQVQNVNGQLVDFTNPKYKKWDGFDNAVQQGDTIQTTPELAQQYTINYKKFYPQFNK